MIAMALACDPAIVIGDEPTTALDVMVQAQILQLLEQLRRDLGLSLMLITHDLSVIAETCDRVHGHVRGHASPRRARSGGCSPRRATRTRRSCSGAFPNIHADRRTLEVIPGMPPDLRNPPPGCRFAPRCPFAMPSAREVVPPEVTLRRRRARRLPPVPDVRRADGRRGRDRRRAARRRRATTRSRTSTRRRLPSAARRSRRRRRPRPRRARDRARCRTARRSCCASRACEVHFPIRGGLLDSLQRRPRGVVRAVDGIDLDDPQGRDPGRWSGSRARARRRPAASSSSSPARPAARIVFDGEDVSTLWGDQGAARLPAARAADLPGPVRDAEPEAHDRRVRGRAARRERDRRRRARTARRGCSRRSRRRACARRGLRRSAIRTSCPAASASAS